MNRVLYAADCLDVLSDPDKLPSASVDLIYLDPPFNSNSNYNLPFKSRDRSLKPVEAFEDTWTWQPGDDERLRDLEKNPRTRPLAAIVQFAAGMESGRGKTSLAAYLLNMAQRLYAMKRVLKQTGSIYLHCDPTASHYLKLLMDGIFGEENFKNEIIWKKRKGMHNAGRKFGSVVDSVLFYGKSLQSIFNKQYGTHDPAYIKKFFRYRDEEGRLFQLADLSNPSDRPNLKYTYKGYPHPAKGWAVSLKRMKQMDQEGRLFFPDNPNGRIRRKSYLDEKKGQPITSIWDDVIHISPHAKERLGYPTQKPLGLMERIIKASSKPGDIVLDPFCGCGTTLHAAETLGRKWIGIDISKFSTGLIRRRLVDNFRYLNRDDIAIHGTPENVAEARELARQDKFEFEKWVCGALDANGLYKNPGEPGADGGVDGVVELPVIRQVGNKFESQTEYVIIQVKGGKVVPDSVKALGETVRRLGAVAGIMVCFRDQMTTVENQRGKALWSDAYKQYPVIQGFSIEAMLDDQRPNLPPTWGYRHGGKTSAPRLL